MIAGKSVQRSVSVVGSDWCDRHGEYLFQPVGENGEVTLVGGARSSASGRRAARYPPWRSGTIVGHPKGAPSRKELEYYNPSVAVSTLTGHLDRLEEVGLIEVVERDREGFERNNIFEPEAYRALFAEVEKTDEIEAAEAVKRPESRD